MKRLLIIGFLLIATVVWGGEKIKFIETVKSDSPMITIEGDICSQVAVGQIENWIKRWAKDGEICKVFGHWWDKPYRVFRDLKEWSGYDTETNSIMITIIKPAGTYRKCKICGGEQKLREEKWQDVEVK